MTNNLAPTLNPIRPEAKDEIPVIDLGPYLAGAPRSLESTAEQLRYAMENVGFYFITGHGVAQADGSLQYGLYVKKIATCKKDTRIEVHTALVTNAGRTWPDQVAARVAGTVAQYKWHLPKDCEGKVDVLSSPLPVADKAAFDVFVETQDKELSKKNPDVKARAFAEAPIPL